MTENKFTTVYCILFAFKFHFHSLSSHCASDHISKFLFKSFRIKVTGISHLPLLDVLLLLSMNETDLYCGDHIFIRGEYSRDLGLFCYVDYKCASLEI